MTSSVRASPATWAAWVSIGLVAGLVCFACLFVWRHWPWRLALGASVGTGGLVFVALLTASRLRSQLSTLREPWFGDD